MNQRRTIAIQLVEVHWSKDERGPEHGRRRKALPDAYPFTPPGDERTDWFHRVSHEAQSDYRAKTTWTDMSDPDERERVISPIKARMDGNHLEIALGEMLQYGKLAANARRGILARLPFRKRVIIRLNNVFDGDCQRLYSEHVVHVGFAERVTLDLPLFREVDLRRILY
jgi:hypothetical protein